MNRFLLFLVVLALGTACTEKPEPPTAAPDAGKKINDTLYIPVLPELVAGLNEPSDVHVGHEPFLYIADTGNDRVVMMDLAGRVVGASARIKRPVAIAQDGLFDLLVAAELDTTINGATVTLGAVYRIRLRDAHHRIADAPTYTVYTEPTRPNRRFTGIAVLPNNAYLLTRIGPLNSSPFDPDNAVLIMTPKDEFFSPVSSLRPVGNALNSIKNLSGISTIGSNSADFVFTQTDDAMQYKAQWLRFFPDPIGDWGQKFDPTQTQNDFLSVRRFSQPEDVTYDNFGNIFIVDAGKDSVFRFSSQGREQYSFGGTGNGSRQFRQPKGVAFYDKTLYVADTGNNRILRFRLSTDQQ